MTTTTNVYFDFYVQNDVPQHLHMAHYVNIYIPERGMRKASPMDKICDLLLA